MKNDIEVISGAQVIDDFSIMFDMIVSVKDNERATKIMLNAIPSDLLEKFEIGLNLLLSISQSIREERKMTIPEVIKELNRMAEIAVDDGIDPRHVNVLFEDPNSKDQSDVSFADYEDGEVVLKH